MYHCVEQVLQINPFTEAIRGHQQPLSELLETLDLLFPFFWSQFPGDGHHLHTLPLESRLELFRHIMSSGDVTAKNHRLKAIRHQFFQLHQQFRQFGIVTWTF